MVKKIIEFDDSDISSVDNFFGDLGYVDLGLSVLWANCNLGADQPMATGSFHSWGEIKEKRYYCSENTVTWNKTLPDISGNVESDAATANLGNGWRTPKQSELEELIHSCKWIWGKYKDKLGFRITGPSGKSIFLPANGEKFKYERRNQESGRYWSSTPADKGTGFAPQTVLAYSMTFGANADKAVYYVDSFGPREYGYNIRPVHNK